MPDVTAIGELLIDFTSPGTLPDGYPILEAHPGGAPANFLAALARYGAKTALLAKVGMDAFGTRLVNTVRALGIDGRGIVCDETAFTTLVFVTLNDLGDREFSFARKPGADTCLRADEIDLGVLEESRVLHFGTLSLTSEPSRFATRHAVEYAAARGKLISFDPNLRLPLWPDPAEAKEQMLYGLRKADIVKISDEEVDFLFGKEPPNGAHHILDSFGAKLVYVTMGKRGCYFSNGTASGFVENIDPGQKTVDTTGAGDIFGGSAMAGVLRAGKPVQQLNEAELTKIVRFACAAASLSTVRYGGITSVPDEKEVLALLAEDSHACADGRKLQREA